VLPLCGLLLGAGAATRWAAAAGWLSPGTLLLAGACVIITAAYLIWTQWGQRPSLRSGRYFLPLLIVAA
jgi:hypothetical protein